MPEKFQTKYSAEEIEALLDKVNQGGGGGETTDNGITIKKLVLLRQFSHYSDIPHPYENPFYCYNNNTDQEVYLEIETHPISNEIANLIRTTNLVRLCNYEMRRNGRHNYSRKHYGWKVPCIKSHVHQYDTRLDVANSCEKYAIPCVQAKDLKQNKDGKYYIHMVIPMGMTSLQFLIDTNVVQYSDFLNYTYIINEEDDEFKFSHLSGHRQVARSARDLIKAHNNSETRRLAGTYNKHKQYYVPEIIGFKSEMTFTQKSRSYLIHPDSSLLNANNWRIKATGGPSWISSYSSMTSWPTDITSFNELFDNLADQGHRKWHPYPVEVNSTYAYSSDADQYFTRATYLKGLHDTWRIGFGILKDDLDSLNEDDYIWAKRYPYSKHLIRANYLSYMDKGDDACHNYWIYSVQEL